MWWVRLIIFYLIHFLCIIYYVVIINKKSLDFFYRKIVDKALYKGRHDQSKKTNVKLPILNYFIEKKMFIFWIHIQMCTIMLVNKMVEDWQ